MLRQRFAHHPGREMVRTAVTGGRREEEGGGLIYDSKIKRLDNPASLAHHSL